MSDKGRKDVSADICEQLENLLEQQHEALLRDDMAAVEKKSEEIMKITAGLSQAKRRLAGTDMERMNAIHDRMISLVLAKKELAGAELATIRQRRSLNKSYRVYDE
jgi:hypothetical protein